ncbi:MAG TPA: hypothetical protein VGK35_09905 [Actinotalea sp.]
MTGRPSVTLDAATCTLVRMASCRMTGRPSTLRNGAPATTRH